MMVDVFRPNNRICFFGDSITAAGIWIREFTDFLLLHHRDKRILPFNCGVPGDSASNAVRRVYADCLQYFPQTVVVMFGMNDIGRPLYGDRQSDDTVLAQRQERLVLYEHSLCRILDDITATGAAVILCTPTPYDSWSDKKEPNLIHCNEGLSECRRILLTLAEKYRAPVVDFYTAFAQQQRMDLIGEDRIHPNEAGHRLMAEVFLRTLGCDPSVFPLPTQPANQVRFETEQILRDISFVEWCLFYDVQGDWETAHMKQCQRIQKALAWKNQYTDQVVEEYRQHIAELNALKGQLLYQTLAMYQNESDSDR